MEFVPPRVLVARKIITLPFYSLKKISFSGKTVNYMYIHIFFVVGVFAVNGQ